MGAKSQTMFNGVQTGRVGAVVGYKRDDSNAPQGIRPYVQPSNPKTYAQSVQRSKFTGISIFIAMCARISDHNMEGYKVGNKNRAAWQRVLFGTADGALQAAKGAQVVAIRHGLLNAYIPVSRGSLGQVNVTTGNLPGDGITLTAENIVSYGLQVNDIVTIMTGTVEDGHLAAISFTQVEVKVGAKLPFNSITKSGSIWTIGIFGDCGAVIIERDGESKHLLSSSYMAGIPVWSAENSEAIVRTYMATTATLANNRYLYGSEFTGTPAPISDGGTQGGGSSSGSGGGGLPGGIGEG